MKIINKTFFLLFVSTFSFAQNQLKPEDTEVWEPQPKIITPGINNLPPSDAIVLFDGKSLDNFTHVKGESPKLEIKDGAFTIMKSAGDIISKKLFGSIQLHIEWRSPAIIEGEGQGRGNSGVFLQSEYEVQIQDNYNNKTYANGQAGALYKQNPPLVNACRKPGEWQTYDIIYMAPKFYLDSTLASPARITVIHNGVLVQNNFELKGKTLWQGMPYYKAHGKAPLKIQEHNNAVSFRNIWVREIE
ncbi:MAG: DUF1080 domain-containing protein [Bacteroidetes bacterium]|nr:MAG: DUF1080 domain-containing protein [Bacteroidota bacterium]